ncbi:MAG: glycoside hydrolase family 3 C-terminal domain-containing protein [Eubacterium sp.]|nr:glycoside hydrolase family 3 C-terminal domain-containing protein [Eubacterium sp.]
MKKIYATTNPEMSHRERNNMQRARKIATSGMVLLENDGTLPLQNIGKIALFGNGARRTVKGGSGSGDVYSRFVVNIEQGLQSAGFEITTTDWMDAYDRAIEEAREAYVEDMKEKTKCGGMEAYWYIFNNPFVEPAMIPVSKEAMEASDTNTAIFVISRKSGEGKDRRPVEGEYELCQEERDALEALVKHYEKVIVVLNVGGVIDTKFLRNLQGINSILLMGQAGNIGGEALADILTGKETPSGHLTSTWGENYLDYPGAEAYSFMNGNLDDEYYNESIFVGYRYFDTFGIKPAYPFGYGLSYTTFDLEEKEIQVDGENITVLVQVKNTGNYSGKEVVQLYISAPDGKLEKPYQELVAFRKTKELKPGEKEVVSLTFRMSSLASFDEETAQWILEQGSYFLRMGKHSRNTTIVANFRLDETVVTEKVRNVFQTSETWEKLSKQSATPFTYELEEQEKQNALLIEIHGESIKTIEHQYEETLKELPEKCTEVPITLDDVRDGKATLEELVGQLTVEEMAIFCVGTDRETEEIQSVIGAASMTPGAAGDTSGNLLETRKIPSMILADGPAGLRLSRTFITDGEGNIIPGTGDVPVPGMDLIAGGVPKPVIPEDAVTYYQYCTAIPIATMIAQSWDEEMAKEAGDIVGGEMKELGIHIWLAPGMNIHRNPLCGRNFEYFSEDPLITGCCAADETLGVQQHAGTGTTIKHFAFNNQEDNRMLVNAYIDERAAREIYLKGFELAVKLAQPKGIMTSYNLINGVHTANSKDLLTYVTRNEWGFEGLVMTDWGTTGSLDDDPDHPKGKYGYSNAAGCIQAGNDLTMPGSMRDIRHIIAAVEKGEGDYPITKAQLQACTKRMIQVIMNSFAYDSLK